MDELIHELRSYAHQRFFDGSEKYDQHILYLADQIEEELAEKEESLVLMDGSLDAMSNTICELCEVLGVEVKGKNDRQIRAELVEAAKSTIPLPKDADGQTIHVGDELVDLHTPRLVVAVSEDSICLAGYESDSYYRMGIAKNYRHHHEQTVEDVLRDVVTLCYSTWKEESPFHFYDVDDVMKSGNIADFATKLRLAGDAE